MIHPTSMLAQPEFWMLSLTEMTRRHRKAREMMAAGIQLGDAQFLYEDLHVITQSGSDLLTPESNKLHERTDF